MSISRKAQLEHDNRQPPAVSESPQEIARAEWLYNAAEGLLNGTEVSFQRSGHKPQVVTMAQLALAVDEHVNRRLADHEIRSPALGWLLLADGVNRVACAELLGRSDHPLGMLGEIAEKLLQPLVDDALIAQAEDDSL